VTWTSDILLEDEGWNVTGQICRRLVGIDEIVPGKVAISKRAWLRLCDSGAAPWGCKVGARRLWDLTEVEGWIAGGCRPVRIAKPREK
jgi:hypothetical protein